MASNLLRSILGVVCMILALVFVGQVLGLLFIERIADRAADASTEVRVPFSVLLVAKVAGQLQEQVLDEPLNPDGTNWPAGFRWFFVLEVIGLAGIAIALAQIGAGLLVQQRKWRIEGRTILMSSILVLLCGILFLKTITRQPRVISPPSKVYDVEVMSQNTPTREGIE